MPRITRNFCEQLIELIDQLETALSEARQYAEEWNDLQDQEPKTPDIREQIRDARENLEAALEELGTVGDLAKLLRQSE
jgi:enamine deaminase RidA (YjgF/YER057c/UK114 family)